MRNAPPLADDARGTPFALALDVCSNDASPGPDSVAPTAERRPASRASGLSGFGHVVGSSSIPNAFTRAVSVRESRRVGDPQGDR